MALALQPAQVLDWCKVDVDAEHITVAASVIEDQTGYTIDAHNTSRLIDTASCRMAWAVVAARVAERMVQAAGAAVTSETEGDYSYTETEGLARNARFASLMDGTPSELLSLDRVRWAHI